MATSSRRSLVAAAASAALLSTCDVLPGSNAFSPPLHAGLTPAASQSPGTSSRPLLQRNRFISSRPTKGTILQSSFIEEPPKRLDPDSENHDGESSSIEEPPKRLNSDSEDRGESSSNDEAATAAAATPLVEREIDDLLEKQTEMEKAKLLRSLTSVTSMIAEKMGKVDESRIAFPDITSGEVPRLYR